MRNPIAYILQALPVTVYLALVPAVAAQGGPAYEELLLVPDDITDSSSFMASVKEPTDVLHGLFERFSDPPTREAIAADGPKEVWRAAMPW